MLKLFLRNLKFHRENNKIKNYYFIKVTKINYEELFNFY